MILAFRNLTLGYEAHPAVHHLSASIEKGMLVALVGPNGAGKSTLLKGIMGQLAPLEGDIQLGDIEKDDIAYLPQQNMVDRSFPISVQEMVALGAWKHMGAFGRLRSKHKKKVAHALQRLGLSGFEKRLIGSLSGGQMQRVLFARLLVQEANLILLDEPFTALDIRTIGMLENALNNFVTQGGAVMLTSHHVMTSAVGKVQSLDLEYRW